MEEEVSLVGPLKDFEKIKKIDKTGIECWEARELVPYLGLDKWANFEDVIKKSIKSAVWRTILPVSGKWYRWAPVQ